MENKGKVGKKFNGNYFSGPVYGLVVGDNGIAKLNLGDKEKLIPFLAPSKSPYPLIGRELLMQEVKQELIDKKNSSVFAFIGIPGVGKTSLAISLAHDKDILRRYSDGVLWVGLGQNPNILAALGSWCSALGVNSIEWSRISSAHDRAQLIKREIGMKSLLIIIDDAWESSSVDIFKVGGPNCAYVITTRIPDIGMQFSGGQAIKIRELNESDSLLLLDEIAPEIKKIASVEAAQLVNDVGGLPLAIILIGKHLWKTAQYGSKPRIIRELKKLENIEKRLQIQGAKKSFGKHPSIIGNSPISLASVIGLSFIGLGWRAKKAIITLSAFPSKPNSFSLDASSFILGHFNRFLEKLIDRGLVEPIGFGRFAIHQTIADFARSKSNLKNARKKIAQYFAIFIKNNSKQNHRLRLEMKNIESAIEWMWSAGMSRQYISTAIFLFPFMRTNGLFEMASSMLIKANRAISKKDKLETITLISLYLGMVSEDLGNYPESADYYKEALLAARNSSDQNLTSKVLSQYGWLQFNQGEYARAEEKLLEALFLAKQVDDLENTAILLKYVGWSTARIKNNYDEAQELLDEGLEIARKLEDNNLISDILTFLAMLADEQGRYEVSEAYLREGIELAMASNLKETLGLQYATLGRLAMRKGDIDSAIQYSNEGLSHARAINQPLKISLLLSTLGWAHNENSDYKEAKTILKEGVELAKNAGHREIHCFLLANLAISEIGLGDYGLGKNMLNESLSVARVLGHKWLISNVQYLLGEMHFDQGQISDALSSFNESHEIAITVDLPELIGLSGFGLARVAKIQNDRNRSRQLCEESIACLERINHSKYEKVKAWLKGNL